MNYYYEEIKSFPYQYEDSEFKKDKFRISVDMGIDTYMQFCFSMVNMFLKTAELSSGCIPNKAKQDMLSLVKDVYFILDRVDKTLTPMSDEFDFDENALPLEHKLKKEFNAILRETSYNKEWWSEIEKALLALEGL